jgi:hypothetical protein
MKGDRLSSITQRQLLGLKVVFSEKAFVAVLQAAVTLGLIYLQTQAPSLPPTPPNQVRPLHNK